MESTRRAPRVSFLIPFFNARATLAESVRSALGQTFQDFEILLVDDGSDDGSLEIAEHFAKKDPRITILHRSHTGLVGALNDGLEQAQGDLIARLDADDLAQPGRLAKQLTRLDAEPDLTCIGGAFDILDEHGRLVGRQFPPCEHDDMVEWALQGRNPICHSAVTYRRQSILDVGGYDPWAIHAEDLDLWLRVAESGTLANLGDVVSRNRCHSASVSQRNRILQHRKVIEIVERAREKRGLELSSETWADADDLSPRVATQSQALSWFYSAWCLGERRTAVNYFFSAIRLRPFSLRPWRFLAGRIRDAARGCG